MSETRITSVTCGSEFTFGNIESDRTLQITASGNDDFVLIQIDEDQARDIVRHLNRQFEMGLRG